eukprot:363012-Chlamydomonas_euryale.AAC.6
MAGRPRADPAAPAPPSPCGTGRPAWREVKLACPRVGCQIPSSPAWRRGRAVRGRVDPSSRRAASKWCAEGVEWLAASQRCAMGRAAFAPGTRSPAAAASPPGETPLSGPLPTRAGFLASRAARLRRRARCPAGLAATQSRAASPFAPGRYHRPWRIGKRQAPLSWRPRAAILRRAAGRRPQSRSRSVGITNLIVLAACVESRVSVSAGTVMGKELARNAARDSVGSTRFPAWLRYLLAGRDI